ncbi:hypothetical protein ACROYT_G008576 [Oculina patagonica]
MFTRTEWLTKSQIQRFLSRLAAKRRKDQEYQGVVGMSPDDEEDVQCLQENSDRQVLVDEVNREINVSHPICNDTYDLCERYHSNTLQKFNVVMLKAICSHFEIHKVKMPFFDGTISQCPQAGFPKTSQAYSKQRQPVFHSTFRSCHGKESTDAIKGVEDDIQDTWKWLDEKYGDPARVADAPGGYSGL